MTLLVCSHKPCWRSAASESGFSTDGGFPLQMRALSELFAKTEVLVPILATGTSAGEMPLTGNALSVVPVRLPGGKGAWRKVGMLWWTVQTLPTLLRAVRRADAIHAPIPGDIGTIGMLLALLLRKPLFVRHCGNWLSPKTMAEHGWRWILEATAGRQAAVLATGGATSPPSARNVAVEWIFSTSLTQRELDGRTAPRAAPTGANVRLVIACRQDERKGTGVVIDALALLQQRMPLASLDVIGDGPDLASFRLLAAARGVGDRVQFWGRLNHDSLMATLDRADLFCYPTRASEGFPKVVLEALSRGLPVVATPVSVLPQLLRRGGGALIARANAEELATAIAAIVAVPGSYARMSAAALETARDFSLERWRDCIGAKLRATWRLGSSHE